MNIILIGFMGAGKTEVGKKLAEHFSLKYVDTDELIEGKGNVTISEIFRYKGEDHFRDLETKTLKELQGTDGHVIATGGGMVLRPENVKMLKSLGPLVLLWADPKAVYQRVRNSKHRPLLDVSDPVAEIKRILDNRTPTYERVADFKVDTSKMTVDEVVAGVEKWLRSK
jgi:shikimate kinase